MISIDSYAEVASYHSLRIAECPLRVLSGWPWENVEYYYNNGYSPKQMATAALVNDFGLTRLLISHGRGEVNCAREGLMIAANMPLVDPVSDIDEFIYPGYRR